jgi:hypothetical protein
MIKLIVILLFFLNFYNSFSQKTIEKWLATKTNDKYTLFVFEDSSCMLIKNNDTLISNNYVFDESPSKSKISIDTTVVPHKIDLMMYSEKLSFTFLTYKGIFEKLSVDKMRVRLNFGLGDRPDSFLPNGNKQTMIFVKEN